MRIGGIVGAIIGFFITKKFFGAFLGYLIGTAFDNMKVITSTSGGAFRGSHSHDQGYYTQRISQNDFATALLVLSGAVMKADGKVLKAELEYVKQFFSQQFPPHLSKQYIKQFRDVLQKDFNLQQVCKSIAGVMPIQQRSLLIQYLFGIAKADGHVSEPEAKIIARIASYLGVPSSEFDQLKSMFYKDAANAYKVLGLDANADIAEIKKAYRKMAIKHHPDKVNQLGEEHQKAAKEKFQKIQDAYEVIKKERGFK